MRPIQLVYFAVGAMIISSCFVAEGQPMDLIGKVVDRANLTGMNLSHLDLGGAHLNQSDLQGSNLNYSNLNGTYLRFAC